MNFSTKILFFSLINFSSFAMQLKKEDSKDYLAVYLGQDDCDKVTLFDGETDEEKFSFSTPNIKNAMFSNKSLYILVISGHDYVNVLSAETGESIKEFCMCYDHKKQDALKLYPELESATNEDY